MRRRQPAGMGSTDVLGSVGFVCFTLAAAAGAASVVQRWRRGDSAERQRLALPALAAGVLGATFLVPTVGPLVPWLDALALVETTVLLACLRHRGAARPDHRCAGGGPPLADLRPAHRSAGGGVRRRGRRRCRRGRTTGARDLIASVVTALVALPLRDRLQVGGRPVALRRAVRPVRRRSTGSASGWTAPTIPSRCCSGVAEAVATILRLPSVRVAVGEDSVAAAVGPEVMELDPAAADATAAKRWVPCSSHLDAGQSGARPARRADARGAAAPSRIGSGVGAAELELQQSRQRIVAAREEERRRLRRDLHDGLGPTLAGIGLGLEVARASHDPAAVRRAAGSLQGGGRGGGAWTCAGWSRTCDRRRWTSSGLVGALRRHADRLNVGRRPGRGGRPRRRCRRCRPRSRWRPTGSRMEAMTNAVRHGRPRHCAVTLSVDGAPARVEVTDDGGGLPDSPGPGVGLARCASARPSSAAPAPITRPRPAGRPCCARDLPVRGPMTEPVRVLLADDHPLYRRGLHQLLDSLDGASVVGEVEDGASRGRAGRAAAARRRSSWTSTCRASTASRRPAQVVAASPHIGVLVLTMHDDDDSVFAAMRAGARGYLLKGAEPAEITRAVSGRRRRRGDLRAVGGADGCSSGSPPAARSGRCGLPGADRPRARGARPDRRRPQQHRHRGARWSSARRRCATTCRNIFTKLQVADRAEAIVRAREAGLGLRP